MADIKFIKATKAWLKTHELVIESCDQNIAFYRKQIALLQKQIAAEQKEKLLKIDLKNDILKTLRKAESEK